MSHTNQPITLGIFHSVQQMLSYSFYSEEKALFFLAGLVNWSPDCALQMRSLVTSLPVER